MNIGIAAGHSGNTVGERLWEYLRCRDVVLEVKTLCWALGHDVFVVPQHVHEMENDDALSAKIEHFNSYPLDVSVEVHLNAGGGQYSTTIYWAKGSGVSKVGKRIAQGINDEYTFPWRTIGARPQTYFNKQYKFLRKCKAPAIITEGGFYDHSEHREYMLTDRGIMRYAVSIALGLDRYAEEAD